MKFDGHAHACGGYLTAKSIVRELARNKLSGVVLCGGEPGSPIRYPYPMLSDWIKIPDWGFVYNRVIEKTIALKRLARHIQQENDRVYQLARQLPTQVKNAYWVDVTQPDWLEKMKQFHRENGFYMLKLHQCWTPFTLADGRFRALFSWAAVHKIPVFIHLWSEREALLLAAWANALPKTSFIVAHLLGAVKMAERLQHTNVWFDLSSPQLYSLEHLRQALHLYPFGRFIAGSDAPYGMHNLSIIHHRLCQLGVSKMERQAIFSKNGLRLLASVNPSSCAER